MTQLRTRILLAAACAALALGSAVMARAQPAPAGHSGHTMGASAMPPGPMAAMPAVYGGDADKPGAPVFTGLGDHRHPISSKNAQTQMFFDQGVRLLFGFNHAEAIRSFREAARLDPDCAICWWGVAFALGPNINLPMQADAYAPAWQALGRARSLAAKASPAERAYIEALARRYTTDAKADRKPLDEAFATAMAQVARAYPDDPDAAVFAAEAMMDAQPWDYWEADAKTPKGRGGQIVALLEGVLAKHPEHPGALHLYIHAVEASSTPERAEAAADRLLPLMPQAGHIVHMPSHIYYRVGRYVDSVKANERAAQVDEQYIAQCKAQGFYPLGYYGHNIHFLWTSSEMLGRSAAALDAARRLVKAVNAEEFSKTVPVGELFVFTPVVTLVRFGKWPQVLAEPAPPASLKLDTAVWLYAQAMARANTGDRAGALAHREKLAALSAEDLSAFDPFGVPARPMVNLALALVDGEIARTGGNLDGAVARFRQGWELERALPYTEPPYWHRPTSHLLGAALMQANRPKEAEAVYRESLTQYRGDGWALFGLTQALEAQGKTEEAAKTRAAFEEAWKLADVKLASSRF